MRILAVAVVVALGSTALAQPGMTPPTYGQPTYGPAPAPPPAPSTYSSGYGYQPAYLQPQPQLDLDLKSSGTAFLWSFGTTAVGAVMFAAAVDNDSAGLGWLSLGLLMIGPSTGHIYAGEGGHALKMSLLRIGGLGVFVLGAIAASSTVYHDCYDYDDCSSGDGDGEAAMWIGGLLVVGTTLYDFYDAGRAATRYNERARRRAEASWQFAPVAMRTVRGGSTAGLGVTGSF